MKKLLLVLLLPLFCLTLKAQYSFHQFSYQGITRSYLLYVPPLLDTAVDAPLVLALHGLGDTISNFKGIQMDKVADTAHFIFVLPQALVDHVLTNSSAWNSGAGSFGVTLNPTVDDVGFLNALIDTVSANYHIDQTRIYSTGFSMGGFMTNRLGCELNNRIAAIASVSGTIGNGITCSATRVVPACHFHGTNDQTVAYSGNLYGNDAEAVVAYWRNHDQCDSTALIDTLAHPVNDGRTYIHYTYPNGAYGSDVEFYKIINGTHQWINNGNINYSVAIWRFFSRYKWLPQSTGIAEIDGQLQFSCYPNPATDQLNLQTEGFTPESISIYNLSGQLVLQNAYSAQISTRNLAAGSYVLQLKAGNKTGHTRFVKM